MKTSDIISKVTDKCLDGGYDAADILALINEGRHQISAEVDLPALITSDTVTTTADSYSVALPADYHKGLYWVWSANQKCRVGHRKDDYHNLAQFLAVNPELDRVGDIVTVCVDGSNLLYQGMAADTLTLRYFKAIDDIEEADIDHVTDGVPSELPGHLQLPLLLNYALKEMYDGIETDIKAPKKNTMHYEAKFNREMQKLRLYVASMLPREPVYVRDVS